MRIVIIGAVAGGTSAAAKARRNSEEHEIVIYDMDSDISYSGCGIPYYIGEDYITRGDLTPRDPSWFKKRFNIDIFTGHIVTDIDPDKKSIEVKNLATGESFSDSYDRLILSTGALPVMPDIPGINSKNVFPVRNIRNAEKIRKFISENNPRKALIIGGGFIGLEMAENLALHGMDITLVESAPHLMPLMDADMSVYIEEHLRNNGVEVITGDSVKDMTDGGGKAVTGKGSVIETDIVIVAIGVRPNTGLIEGKGIRTGKSGGIIVNDRMETSLPGIYAVGDCCEVESAVTGEYIYRPLGSTANKMGRVAGDAVTGGDLKFRSVQGTGIFRTFGLSVAHTGISEKEASDRGLDILVSHNIKDNRSKYLKESREIVIKCIVERRSGKILGVQIIGEDGVDKRIDVFVTAMTFGAKIEDLFHLALAYAPPFSTTKDPVIYSGMILHNASERGRMLVTPSELIAQRESFTVIDVRSSSDYEKGHIEGAINIPHAELKAKSVGLDKTKKYAVHCNKGTTGNAAQNLLLNMGFSEVYNISGGYSQYKMELKLK